MHKKDRQKDCNSQCLEQADPPGQLCEDHRVAFPRQPCVQRKNGKTVGEVLVPEGRVGAIIVGGLNPIAVLEEREHRIFSRALSGLIEHDRLFRFEEFPRRLQSYL